MSQDVLIVKLSSLGDIVHGFAVLGDLQRCIPDVRVVWAVEEAFADLVAVHPLVNRVISVPMRRLRREQPWRWFVSDEWRKTCHTLGNTHFDVALDLQGLLKSAWLMRKAQADVYAGYHHQSIREPLASLFYSQKFSVSRDLHAVTRMRQLMAQVFQYDIPDTLDYGLQDWQGHESRELLFFHGTTWLSKLLPEQIWYELITLSCQAGFTVSLPWGNDEEFARAQRLSVAGAQVLPYLSLPALQEKLRTCAGAISVDTGLGHLAAACGTPVLGVFAPTDVNLVGIMGRRTANLAQLSPCLTKDCRQHGGNCAQACMAQWSAGEIWTAFMSLIGEV